MESFEDSNCCSMSDSFSLYERYLRSFNVVNNFREQVEPEPVSLSSNCDYETPNIEGNIDLSAAVETNRENSKQYESALIDCVSLTDKVSLNAENTKIASPCPSLAPSLCESSSHTVDHSLNDKSDPVDVPVSSDESKSSSFKQPIFLTSTMENSNNAVDMLRDVRHSESVFKLPISELSFNGTIKHVQKLKPIVDPITALTANAGLVNIDEKSQDESISNVNETYEDKNFHTPSASDVSDEISTEKDKGTESTEDSHYDDYTRKENTILRPDDKSMKWSNDQSYSSLEASYDSGVRSPDMFGSDEEDVEPIPPQDPEPFWSFLKDFEQYDKKKVRKMEEKLQGILPPPSVTTLRTDVTEMLKKYYSFLPAFTNEVKVNTPEVDPVTPTKRVSFVEIPIIPQMPVEETVHLPSKSNNKIEMDKSDHDLDTSADKSIVLDMCTEAEVKESSWPQILKCRHYDVYYNLTSHSEKMEILALRYGERYVGAETENSVNVYSGGLQSPSSAHKRKALRLKLAQAKSPGRRLSHLARRRQAFCSAATINEKAQAGSAKMVLIDKNYFPHRKLINSSERKSPRLRRTPGKKTPTRKTPGKKTPAKTPKTKSGGSSRKKIMRRLLMDSDSMTRSQPTRETLKRALFISPENRKGVPTAPSTSVPLQAMKSKRALFSSPDRGAETKSADGTQSDHFMKRKLSALDEQPESSRAKIAKSLSFGGDTIGNMSSQILSRRASEVFSRRNSVDLNETHKKKLLWAVSEALRVHGWRMSSPGFREKAEALARLTRRLLALPPHAAKLASPKLSTSETMLKLARQYVFAIIQGRSIEECFQEEQMKLSDTNSSKISGYISANEYQQFKAKQNAPNTSQIKENTCNGSLVQDQPRSGSKNVLQDKLLNVDSSSSSSSGFSMLDKSGLYKSNSMPSFEEAAKMRARRQISFDNLDFPKR